ncbi:hypothetical protein HMN09_00572300 [Mycena chlorophos]|uniref:Transmembrane protein n=1 Tax=Mycena chlorophos TaxID=658473 RepID=A0A8H6WDS9_MYCCL|nr:hypothetical protein HMN09_00572300 [Mycena chlorophos]
MASFLTIDGFYLAASWWNAMLYTLELVLMYRYLTDSRHTTRPCWHKVGMGLLFIFDSTCTFAIFAYVYMFVLLSPVQPPAELYDRLYGSLAAILVSSYASAAAEQLFLTYIFCALTKQRIISGIFCLAVLVHAAFSYTAAALVVKTENTFDHFTLLLSQAGAISCAITDVIIAIALTTAFLRLDTKYAVRRSMHWILRRLMIGIATGGVIVATNTLLTVVLLMKNNPAEPLFFFPQGRMYSLTVLANFLAGNLSPSNATRAQGAGGAPGTSLNSIVFRVGYTTTTMSVTDGPGQAPNGTDSASEDVVVDISPRSDLKNTRRDALALAPDSELGSSSVQLAYETKEKETISIDPEAA